MKAQTLDLLWRRVEDAKRRLDALHKVVAETKLRTDGSADYARAVSAQQMAASAYLQAVDEFMAAITIDEAPRASDGQSLTVRERDVLALVASGKSSREIAEELGIAFKTVTTHRYRLQKKLNAHHTADLTRIAIRMGLAQP